VVLRIGAVRDPRLGRLVTQFSYTVSQDRSFSSGDLQLDYVPVDLLEVECPCGYLNRLDLKVLRRVSHALTPELDKVPAQDPELQ